MMQEYYPSIRKMAMERHIPIVLPETTEFLWKMVETQHPKSILELGTAVAYSSLIMARAGKWELYVDTVEASRPSAEVARQHVEKYDKSHSIRIHCDQALHFLQTCGKKYDMIFADARKDEYSGYFSLGKSCLNPGGIMFFDNMNWHGKVLDGLDHPEDKRVDVLRKFRQEFLTDPGGRSHIENVGDGMGIFVLDT